MNHSELESSLSALKVFSLLQIEEERERRKREGERRDTEGERYVK